MLLVGAGVARAEGAQKIATLDMQKGPSDR